MPYNTALVALAGLLGIGGMLVGCQSPAVSLNEPATPPSASKSDSPKVTEDVVLAFDPEGGAEENLDFFTQVMSDSGAGTADQDVIESVEALIEAGFDPSKMSHTAPESQVKLPVDSVSVAVKMDGMCLVAQFTDKWLTTAVATETQSGCLIGKVVSVEID